MAAAAMVAWLLAAGAGLLLLAEWLNQGGARSGTSHLPEPLVVTHFVLAAAGTIVWIVYLLSGSATVAWAGFALAGLISLLGVGLLVRWLPVRAGGDELADVPEKHFPPALVGTHGLFAAAIVLLTLLAALGV